MRVRAETLLILAMGLFALTGLAAAYFLEQESRSIEPPIDPYFDPTLVDPTVGPTQAQGTGGPTQAQGTNPVSARGWFDEIRRFCNPVDVVTRMRWQPAPDTDEGHTYEAACYALAGRIDLARASIERLPPSDRYRAAGVVFEAGHPAADAGDELAAGPLMELVVEFWPNHYMALYHAGAAAYERDEHERAGEYLRRFLVEYSAEDGWRTSAEQMLKEIER